MDLVASVLPSFLPAVGDWPESSKSTFMSRSQLYSAGSNAKGQLATRDCEDAHTFTPCSFGDYTPGALPVNIDKVVQIACGANHTLALLKLSADSGLELWGCGDGTKGQLGILPSPSPIVEFQPLSLQLPFPGFSMKSIASGWETSYLVLSTPEEHDVLVSFGSNDFGALGCSQTKEEKREPAYYVRFPLPAFLDAREPYELTIDSLSASVHHVIAVANISQADRSRAVVYGWGTSRTGQLGNILKSGRPVPFTPSPVIVYEAPSAHQLIHSAVGRQHTALLDTASTVLGLGSNRKQQLARVDTLQNVIHVACTWNGTYCVVSYDKNQWSVLATGDNSKGQLGSPQSLDTPQSLPRAVQFPFSTHSHEFVKIACGSEHILCLFILKDSTGRAGRPKSEVWAWGWNEHGNLGLGHTADVNTPVKVWPSSEISTQLDVIDLWAGCGTSWISCLS